MITWTVRGQRNQDPSYLRECKEEKQLNRALEKNYAGDNIYLIECSPALWWEWKQFVVILIKNCLGQRARCPEKLLKSRIVPPTCSSPLPGLSVDLPGSCCGFGDPPGWMGVAWCSVFRALPAPSAKSTWESPKKTNLPYGNALQSEQNSA